MKAIFIGGCERSGTTLLGSLIGRMDSAICTPESQFKYGLCDANSKRDMKRIKYNFRLGLWNLGENVIDKCISSSSSGMELLNCLVAEYSKKKARNNQVEWWVDHTPNNLKKSWYLERYFPNARYIHIVRDGRGVAASVMPLDWGPNTALWAGPWWVRQVGYGLAAEKMIGERAIRVKYEELLSRPRYVLSKISEYLDLPIDMHLSPQPSSDFQVPSYSDNQHELIGSSIDESRATAWKDDLSNRQIRDFESESFDMLKMLGYECMEDIKNGIGADMNFSYKAVRFMQDKVIFNLLNKMRKFIRAKKSC